MQQFTSPAARGERLPRTAPEMPGGREKFCIRARTPAADEARSSARPTGFFPNIFKRFRRMLELRGGAPRWGSIDAGFEKPRKYVSLTSMANRLSHLLALLVVPALLVGCPEKKKEPSEGPESAPMEATDQAGAADDEGEAAEDEDKEGETAGEESDDEGGW
jgi:hypothetical protein